MKVVVKLAHWRAPPSTSVEEEDVIATQRYVSDAIVDACFLSLCHALATSGIGWFAPRLHWVGVESLGAIEVALGHPVEALIRQCGWSPGLRAALFPSERAHGKRGQGRPGRDASSGGPKELVRLANSPSLPPDRSVFYHVGDRLPATLNRIIHPGDSGYTISKFDADYGQPQTVVDPPLSLVEVFQWLYMQLVLRLTAGYIVDDVTLGQGLRGDNLGAMHFAQTGATGGSDVRGVAEFALDSAWVSSLQGDGNTEASSAHSARFPSSSSSRHRLLRFPVTDLDRLILLMDLGQGYQPEPEPEPVARRQTTLVCGGVPLVGSSSAEGCMGMRVPVDELVGSPYVPCSSAAGASLCSWASTVRLRTTCDVANSLLTLFDLASSMLSSAGAVGDDGPILYRCCLDQGAYRQFRDICPLFQPSP